MSKFGIIADFTEHTIEIYDISTLVYFVIEKQTAI